MIKAHARNKILVLMVSVLLVGCDRTRTNLPPVFDITAFPDYKAPSLSIGSEYELKQELSVLKRQLKHAETKLKLQEALINTLKKPSSVLKINKGEQNHLQSEWEEAVGLLKRRHYREAQHKLQQFIKKHSNSSQHATACYFLGQLMLLEGKPDRALSYFSTFVNQYPKDNRMPDAKFQMGLAHYAKGDNKKASQMFNQIYTMYPNRNIGQKAKQHCLQLEKTGVLKE
jgi:tol-pal system protein YbgF